MEENKEVESTQPEEVKVEAQPKAEEASTTANASGEKTQEDYFAIGSLVVGIFNLCVWILPLCGCPMAIIGIVLGYLGMQKSKSYKNLAIAGIVLSTIGLIFALLNAAYGAYMGATGEMYNY